MLETTHILPYTKCLLSKFRKEHPSWSERLDADSPVYAIPWPACDHKVLRALFDEDSVAAEIKYAAVGWNHGSIGMANRILVIFSPLLQTTVTFIRPVTPDTQNEGKVPNENQAEIIDATLDRAHERLLGIVGFLKTSPDFQLDVGHVKVRFDALPSKTILAWPLSPPVNMPNGNVFTMNGVHPAIDVANLPEYITAMKAFFAKWGLNNIATWNWVTPQGPMIPNYLQPGARAGPTGGLAIWLSVAYPLTGDDKLMQQIRTLQKQAAIMQGQPIEMAALEHHEQYAQLPD